MNTTNALGKRRNEMNTTNALGKTKQRKKTKVCEMSADKVLQAIEDAKTGPDAFECVRHYARVKQHYDNAREKHPYFCDWIHSKESKDIQFAIAQSLDYARRHLNVLIENSRLGWNVILECEMLEVYEALANGDKAHAVEECYDAIAVLLRTIDVLEGRQPLGKPKKEGGAK